MRKKRTDECCGAALTSIPSSEFLADAVIEQLRRGIKPSECDADLMNRVPFVDILRERVKRADLKAWVLPALNSKKVEWTGLCLSLLRKFDIEKGIQDLLRRKWEKASPHIKAHLMWRILDASDLPLDWHRRIFEFILTNRAAFHDVSLKFLGTRETIIAEAKRRYDNPRGPETKKWAYLCRVAAAASDPKEAKSFLKKGLTEQNEFTRYVAKVLLKRFYSGGS